MLYRDVIRNALQSLRQVLSGLFPRVRYSYRWRKKKDSHKMGHA